MQMGPKYFLCNFNQFLEISVKTTVLAQIQCKWGQNIFYAILASEVFSEINLFSSDSTEMGGKHVFLFNLVEIKRFYETSVKTSVLSQIQCKWGQNIFYAILTNFLKFQ